jgi:hypothetical protein
VSSPVVAWKRLSTADVSLPLGSRTIPMPQLPASNNSSQRLNCSSHLIAHRHTHSTVLNCTALINCSAYNILARTAQKTQFLCCCIHCCVRSHQRGPHRKHRFPASPLTEARNLPTNGRCFQSHFLATGVHVTAHTAKRVVILFRIIM